MSKLSLELSSSTLEVITTIAKQNNATIKEVAHYLLTKGLAHYAQKSTKQYSFVAATVAPGKQVEL